MEVHNPHDKAYKALFANPIMVKELLDIVFEGQAWVHEIDYAHAEQVKRSFISGTRERYEADVIYRLPLHESEFYIYLFIEHQSSPDKHIAVRLLNYITLFYVDLLRDSKSAPDRLPFVLPIVLYNGEARWNAPPSIEDLIHIPKAFETLSPYMLSFRYVPVIMYGYDKGKMKERRDAMGYVFFLENADNDEFRDVLTEYRTVMKTFLPAEVGTFDVWLLYRIDRDRNANELGELLDNAKRSIPKEVLPMLDKAIKAFKDELIEQGIEQGVQQGVQQGREEGVQQGQKIALTSVARNLIKANEPIDKIVAITGLSREEIEALM